MGVLLGLEQLSQTQIREGVTGRQNVGLDGTQVLGFSAPNSLPVNDSPDPSKQRKKKEREKLPQVRWSPILGPKGKERPADTELGPRLDPQDSDDPATPAAPSRTEQVRGRDLDAGAGSAKGLRTRDRDEGRAGMRGALGGGGGGGGTGAHVRLSAHVHADLCAALRAGYRRVQRGGRATPNPHPPR